MLELPVVCWFLQLVWISNATYSTYFIPYFSKLCFKKSIPKQKWNADMKIKATKTFIKLISIFLYSFWCTIIIWLCVQGHESCLLHKRVDIKKQHIVTRHIYIYLCLINPIKYLLCPSDIYISQPIIYLLQIPTPNQSNVPVGMRPEHKEVSCGIRPYIASLMTIFSGFSHRKIICFPSQTVILEKSPANKSGKIH